MALESGIGMVSCIMMTDRPLSGQTVLGNGIETGSDIVKTDRQLFDPTAYKNGGNAAYFCWYRKAINDGGSYDM